MMKTIYRRLASRWRSGESDEAGQALIELAVSLPLLMVMLLGAAEMARLAYMAIEVSEAAKGAAQYGAQNAAYSQDLSGITLAAQKDAPYVYGNCTSFSATAVHQTTGGRVQLPCACVTNGVQSPATATIAACSTACASGSYPVTVLQISTSASCDPLTHGIGLAGGSITLRGSAVQVVLN